MMQTGLFFCFWGSKSAKVVCGYVFFFFQEHLVKCSVMLIHTVARIQSLVVHSIEMLIFFVIDMLLILKKN